MSSEQNQRTPRRLPKGFAPGSSGLASEYAREMGWDLNEDERKHAALEKQESDGGLHHDYGARDFGDEAKDTSAAVQKQDGAGASGDAQKAGKDATAGRKIFAIKLPFPKPALGRTPTQKPIAVKRVRTA